MTTKEEPKQIKCYCGHTTYCDCGPIETTPNKTNMTQQTAVEWLVEQFKDYDCTPSSNNEEYVIVMPKWIFNAKKDEAKEMEKEQIMYAFDEGQEYEYQYHINSAPKFDSLTYYNETFKQQ